MKYNFGCNDILLVLLALTAITVIAAYIYLDYIPGWRITIIGPRGYKIFFKYGDINRYGFTEKQNDIMRYYLELIAHHITAYGLTNLYWTKSNVQRLADEYYDNLHVAYEAYKKAHKGKYSQDEYQTDIRLMESKNHKIIQKLKKLNSELVNFIDYFDECVEEGYDGPYDLSHIGDCLKDEEIN